MARVPVKHALPLAKVYALLEPGPVVLVTSAWRGQTNVMTMSWHMMVEFEPPQIACIISNRNHSFTALRATRECVIAIPTVALAAKVVACGNCSGRDVDKFSAIGLTPVPGAVVRAPLVAECYANLECQLADARMIQRYNMFLWEVKRAWIDPQKRRPRTLHHLGYGKFMVSGPTIRLASRMR
jgi:flavin reductase (DIM6/NTAB) family NADH-FMN oxidoreductase RutF